MIGSAREDEYRQALDAAHRHALGWLDSMSERPIRPEADADEILARLNRRLPEAGISPSAVVDELAEAAGPGLIAMGSPRFFGLVIGGTYPAAMAADWLLSSWDQNSGARQLTPSTSAVEEVAAGWLLELLDLPRRSGVGFVTGGTTANLSALIVARDAVLRNRGHDASRGIQSAPRIGFLAGDREFCCQTQDEQVLRGQYGSAARAIALPLELADRSRHGLQEVDGDDEE